MKMTVSPTARWQPLRWLFLQSKSDFDRNRSLVLRDLVQGAEAYAFVGVVCLWGRGWPNYHTNLTLAENIKRAHGDADFFDVIYFEQAMPDVAGFQASRTVLVSSQPSCPQKVRDADGRTCGDQLSRRKADIVAIGNAQETLTNQELHSISTESVLVHWPAMASPAAAVGIESAARPVDVLLLRSAASFEAETPEWLGPSISSATFDMQNLGAEWPAHGGSQGASTQLAELLQHLKTAKIVITDTTPRKYWVPEFSHALMAGTLIISDVPGENARILRRYGVVITSGQTRAELRVLVGRWLENDAGRVAKVQAGAVGMWTTLSIDGPNHLVLWGMALITSDCGLLASIGQAFAAQNLGPASFFDLVSETYYEVISSPFGEDLVGKKFLHPFSVQVRAQHGLSSDTMALITSGCGATRSLSIK